MYLFRKFAFSPLPSPKEKQEHLLNMAKKMNKNGLSAYLPENFNADAILDTVKMNKTKRNNLKASMYYILSTLYQQSHNRKNREDFEENGGYPLNAKHLNRLLGNRYKEAINLLEKHGVIIRSESYKPGERSKLMSLTGMYAAAATKIREIPLAATIRKKLLADKLDNENKNDQVLNKIPFITKWFNPGRLSVDEKTVHGFIEFYRAEMLNGLSENIKNGITIEEMESRINYRVNNMIETMENFRRGEMRLTKTGKDHRLHSFLSNTKKELRTMYMFDGKPLVSIDLKSSQPYLLNYLLNPENWKKEIKALMPELYQNIKDQEQEKGLQYILMFAGFGDIDSHSVFNKVGFPSFPWKTEDFYSDLVTKSKEAGCPKIFPDRETTKRKIMMILYDDGVYKNNAKDFQRFSEWYPKEAKLIKFFNRLSRKAKMQAVDSDTITNFLPILLQRLESKLMLENICGVIAKEIPDAPLLPVHDCIHTTIDYAEKVKLIIERELTKIIGTPPGIKIEEYNQQKTMDELSKLAHEDMAEITNKKSKSKIDVKIKPPFLQETPQNGNDWLISYRYDAYSKGLYQDEKLIRLIDDTGNK